ncbi:MAG: metalloregulator ArsR/SmtB family transcription factor [Desulfobacteraceae bacterium]|nr:metalloregulator ArsR/SmtB family transcription factor [Desulfobacteraceae bacterium]
MGPKTKTILNAERFASICKALAHPARVRIVDHLNQLNQCICGQIVEVLPLAQSTVSQHLKILKEAGLVKDAIDGPRTCYCLDRQVIEEFRSMAAQFGQGGAPNE